MNDIQTIPTDDITEEDQQFPLHEMWKLRYKHNYSYQQIADKMGCNKSNVIRKLQGYISMLPNADEIQSYQNNKTTVLQAMELLTIKEMMSPQKIKDASFNNLAYGFNTIYQANRLESGKSTSNINVVEVQGTISDLQAQADILRKSL